MAVQLAILYLPVLQALFGTELLGPVELVVVLVASTAAFLAVELEKLIIRRRSRRSRHAPDGWPSRAVPDASTLLLGG